MAYNLGPVKPWVSWLANTVGPKFGIKNIGGWRESDPYPDHPGGWALDWNINGNKATGDALANHLRDNAQAYGIDYIIWNDRVWSVARANEGWRPYQPSNPSRNRHTDHVHTTSQKSAPSGYPGGGGLGGGGVLTPDLDLSGTALAGPRDLVGAVGAAANALGSMASGVRAIGALAEKLMWLALPTTQVRIGAGILGIIFLFMGVRLLVKEAK